MSNELIDLTKFKPSEAFAGLTRPTSLSSLELMEACGRAGAASLKVRVSTDAKLAWHMPKSVKEAKLLNETAGTIDLEIVFRSPRKRQQHQPSA